MTHIFKKRVEFDTAKKRASHAAAESFSVYLGSQIVSICSDSGGSWSVYHLTGCQMHIHPAEGIRSIVDDRGALERRPKPSSRGVPAACGEGTLDRDYSQPIARNATSLGGNSIYSNVENKWSRKSATKYIIVTHVFKKRVEIDTREACSNGIVLCVSRVTDRLNMLGFRRFLEFLSSHGLPEAYTPS